MRREIEFLRYALHPDFGIEWCTPIAHLISRDPTGDGASDACLDAGGGYSIPFRFIWFLNWPTWVLLRTKKFLKNDKDGNFISINILEFISVILEYCAALTVVETEDVTEDKWPVFLASGVTTKALCGGSCKHAWAPKSVVNLEGSSADS